MKDHAVSIYFFHAGKGQSTAIRLHPNHWIVLDADYAGFGKQRCFPALDLLRKHEEKSDFRLLAVVLSHFHTDHYRALPELLEHYEQRGQLETVIVPVTVNSLRDWIRWSPDYREGSELDSLLGLFERLGDKVRPLDAFHFLWPVKSGELTQSDPFVFCLHPRHSKVVDAFGQGGRFARNQREHPRPPTLVNSRPHTDANAYSFVFSVGYGREATDLHVLLTADLAGKSFATLTRGLRETWVPQVVEGLAGSHRELLQLVVEEPTARTTSPSSTPPAPRFRPINALSVPHHGSNHDLPAESDLQWWLRGGTSPNLHPVAIVQGSVDALDPETFDRLCALGLRVFASSWPRKIAERGSSSAGPPDALSARLLQRPSQPPVEPPGHLGLHGDSGGIQLIEARSFYEIRCPRGEIVLHEKLHEVRRLFTGLKAAGSNYVTSATACSQVFDLAALG